MQRALRWFAVAWAAGVYLVLLRLPMYSSASSSQTAGGPEIRSSGRATLAAVNGPSVYLILAVPVLASVLAVLRWPPRLSRPATIVGAVIASGFVVLGMATVGMFFVPTALALITVAAAGRASPRPAA
jgi:hypothetical protein